MQPPRFRVTRRQRRHELASEAELVAVRPGTGTPVITALQRIIGEKKRMDKVIEQTLRERKSWEPAQRASFVEAVQDAVRWWRWRWFCASQPDTMYLKDATVQSIRRALAAAERPRNGGTPAIRASFPDWLWDRAQSEIGRAWSGIADALNQPAPFHLRVNTLKTDTEKLIRALGDEGSMVNPVPGFPSALRADRGPDLFRTRAFRDGGFEVQDVHSQSIAPLLDVQPGQRVVDACAGTGGKTLHLAALMKNKGRIVAFDAAEWRLAELRRRAARAGVDNLEARELPDTKKRRRIAESADRLLLDVPCSGTGVLRRNPDIKWRLQPAELQRLLSLQATLLQDYSPLVKPGGKLLYVTCSVLPSEGERQIEAFLAAHPGWKLETQRRFDPGDNGGDGFFAARLIRQRAGEA